MDFFYYKLICSITFFSFQVRGLELRLRIGLRMGFIHSNLDSKWDSEVGLRMGFIKGIHKGIHKGIQSGIHKGMQEWGRTLFFSRRGRNFCKHPAGVRFQTFFAVFIILLFENK